MSQKPNIDDNSDVSSGQKMAFQFQFKYGPLAEMLYIVDLLLYLHVVQCQRLDQDLKEQQVGETERMKQHYVFSSIFILEIIEG